MLWLYLHFPQLLLDHISRSRQEITPLAIITGAQPQVIQACPAARQQGVHPGMPLKTAFNLAPDLAMVRMDEDQQTRILEQQAHWLYRYLDRITLFPPDGLLAEISSVQKLYRGLENTLSLLTEALQQRQLSAHPAMGLTPLAARLTARTGHGVCSADTGELERAVAALPLSAAEFDPRTLQRLTRLGLTRLREVFDLPATELARRLTPEVLAHVQRIQGRRPDPQVTWQPPHHFRQRADFAQDIEQAQSLLFALKRILGELETDLRWRQQDTDSLLLVLHHRHHEATRLRLRTTGPEHRADAFLSLLRIRFEQQPLVAPVYQLELVVKRFLSRQPDQHQDLLEQGGSPQEAWNTLISRLQARLGEQALSQLSPRADHRPERAWSADRLQEQHSTALPAASDRQPTPPRPLWLLSKPQPLTVTPGVWLAGPERICGGWWDGQKVQRDYYTAQLPSGQLAWVFRDVREGWFIHGWFG